MIVEKIEQLISGKAEMKGDQKKLKLTFKKFTRHWKNFHYVTCFQILTSSRKLNCPDRKSLPERGLHQLEFQNGFVRRKFPGLDIWLQ